jgi:hypothetical protein
LQRINSPDAVWASREGIFLGLGEKGSFEAGKEFKDKYWVPFLREGRDSEEGIATFVERRKPKWIENGTRADSKSGSMVMLFLVARKFGTVCKRRGNFQLPGRSLSSLSFQYSALTTKHSEGFTKFWTSSCDLTSVDPVVPSSHTNK